MDHRVLSSPHLNSTPSWPLESFGDLRLSGSEPKIFPGLVSRTQRKDSLNVRKGSGSEGDFEGYYGKGDGSGGGGSVGGMGHTRKGRSASSLREVGGIVDEEQEAESDGGSN